MDDHLSKRELQVRYLASLARKAVESPLTHSSRVELSAAVLVAVVRSILHEPLASRPRGRDRLEARRI